MAEEITELLDDWVHPGLAVEKGK